ncbi:hypothetical protein EV421DRAFT_1759855 [Armillaria borealis]|uniref:SET domain-containing protein n=1 Tax=Armillaria borealis TaxID=47425 RepID=A0AA39K7U9_9AGAR|nr:hypothetical protein EV421DRAFT_1759855 [Armillaria borealis]
MQIGHSRDLSTTMPPGKIANSAAAKKAAAKKAKRKASQQAGNTNEAVATSSQIDKDVPVSRFSYGVVENTALPEGYVENKLELSVTDADKKWDKDDINLMLYTTQPSVNLDTTLADFPGGWTECMVSAPLKSTILETPGYPAHIKRPDTPAHCISESPWKGLGMFAMRKVTAGALILAERALMITPAGVRGSAGIFDKYPAEQAKQAMLFEWEKELEVAYKRMPEEHQMAFMALYNSHTQDGSGPIMGVIRTNGYGLGGLQDEWLGPGSEGAYTGVFNELSRLNHSCRPNTYRTFDMVSFAMEIRAVRDIEQGEEFTTYYSDLLVPTTTRQQQLEPYGVRCDCTSCSNPRVSDDRRMEIVKKCKGEILADRFSRWSTNPRLSDDFALREGERLLKLVEDEGLETEICYSELLLHLAMVHAALGNTEETGQYTVRWMTAHVARGRPLEKLFEEIMTLKQTLAIFAGCRGRLRQGSGEINRMAGKLREMKV